MLNLFILYFQKLLLKIILKNTLEICLRDNVLKTFA